MKKYYSTATDGIIEAKYDDVRIELAKQIESLKQINRELHRQITELKEEIKVWEKG